MGKPNASSCTEYCASAGLDCLVRYESKPFRCSRNPHPEEALSCDSPLDLHIPNQVCQCKLGNATDMVETSTSIISAPAASTGEANVQEKNVSESSDDKSAARSPSQRVS